MSSHMEWSPDFCLHCDRQMSEGGAYCSQQCRLLDLEKGTTEPQTPSQLSSSASSTTSSTNGFYLPPAVNFSAYKSSTSSKGFDMGYSSHQNYYPTTNGQYFVPATHSRQQQQQQSHQQYYQYQQHQSQQYHQQQQQQYHQQRSLTPSSSRSSLASTQSQQASGISAHAATQLNNYVRQFDQTREVKRRFT